MLQIICWPQLVAPEQAGGPQYLVWSEIFSNTTRLSDNAKLIAVPGLVFRADLPAKPPVAGVHARRQTTLVGDPLEQPC